MRELFPGQNVDEKIYILVREHPVRLIIRVLIWLVLVAVLIAFRVYAPEGLPFLFEGIPGTITSIFEQIYMLFLALSLFVVCVLYYLNLNIVTELRIVDIDQCGLFKHEVSILNLSQIEDVTSDTKGILGTVFDYGTVHIQTAGARERFEMHNVPHPARLAKVIIDLFEANQEKNTNVKNN